MQDPRFRPYQQNQMRLLPLDLSEMIPENHLVRVVDAVVESIDLAPLRSLYPGGGAPAHDPGMMLKVVIYAYATGVYSSRKISEATKANVHFMWLTGCTPLDHMTVNRFRTERLRGCFEAVFAETVGMLADMGLVTLDAYFLDGTKVEANASRYSFTWRKSVEKNRGKLRVNVGRLLDEIDALNDEEDRIASGLPEPGEVTAEDVAEVARRINERLRARPGDKALKKAQRKVESDYLPRMERYERDLADMGDRKSLSKTDRDATFMRMKEDHMGNGQLKAGYNVQNGTENQFVVHCTVHQRPGDTACMKPHLESLRSSIGRIPADVVADAGYGSEENYAYLEGEGVRAFVKHNMFHREQRRSFAKDPSQPANWTYDAEADEYVCSGGRRLAFAGERKRASDLGWESTVRVYLCDDCSGCEHAARCLRGKSGKRSIEVNPLLAAYRKRASDLLTSDEGLVMRRRRATDVETVFGDVKRNWGFKRFTLRGIGKVAHEWRLLMMGHNMRKLAKAVGLGGKPASLLAGGSAALA